VLGEWVVGLQLPEPVALLLLAATLGINWARAVRADWLPLYKLRPGLIALALWLGLLVLVSLLPASPRPLDAIVSATLTFVAVGCSWLGRLGARPPATWRERLWAAAARVVAGLVTLLAVASALNRL